MNQWINFAEIRQKISIEMVIEEYAKITTLKRQGNKLIGPCPVHGGDSPRAFHVDLDRNIWHCFTQCSRGGNQVDLVALKEGISIRDAYLNLQKFFLSNDYNLPKKKNEELSSVSKHRTSEVKLKEIKEISSSSLPPSIQKEEKVNPPLNVNLSLKPDHPNLLQDRELKLETIKHFNVGYCSRGIMKGCIAIPVHDEENNLVAYAGRRLKPKDIREKGKYKFPKGFRKELVLFNLNRVGEFIEKQGIVLVEGFFSVLKLYETGFPNTVASMGCSLSDAQAKLLSVVSEIIIIYDNTKAGVSGALAARQKLEKYNLPVRIIWLPNDCEPEDLSPECLQWAITGIREYDLSEISLSVDVHTDNKLNE